MEKLNGVDITIFSNFTLNSNIAILNEFNKAKGKKERFCLCWFNKSM